MEKQTTNLSYLDATGKISYNMTNDYMFRAVLQKNKKVLTELIRSLLHYEKSDMLSVEITNPIELGKSFGDKEYWLDVNVMLNNNTKINLEMQVVNEGNWTDRSLSYLCRSYDSLYRGQIYSVTLPVIHIGFLDYTLFKDAPEFYATYKFQNVKNHKVYSDKIQLGVIDLSQIELATEEDKRYGIDYWASLFKVSTWEELKAMTKTAGLKNEAISEAAQTMYELTADENIREQCRRRDDYYRQIRTYEKDLAEKDAEIAKIIKITKEKDAEIAGKDAEIKRITNEKEIEIAGKDAEIASKEIEIASKEKEIAELLAVLERYKSTENL